MTAGDDLGQDIYARLGELERALQVLRQEADRRAGPQLDLPREGNVEIIVAQVGGGEYGFLGVEEMLRLPRLLPLPGAPSSVLGILDLRGRHIPVVSAHRRLGLPLAPLEIATPLVVCSHGPLSFAVLVEEVTEMVTVPRASIVPPPDQVPCAKFVLGVAEVSAARKIVVFDPGAFFSFEARSFWRDHQTQAADPAAVSEA